jgi:hypothetical protein
VALQVQAAWLGPNLLRLAHAWLLQAPPDNAIRVVSLLFCIYEWAEVQLAPRMHPCVLQLGVGGPAVAAAVAAGGSVPPEQLQVSGVCDADTFCCWALGQAHAAS